MPSAEADFYDDPAVYDVLHTPGTAREVDGLEHIAHRFATSRIGKNGAVWLEPACGSGRYLRVIAGRGGRAVGMDLNEGMIAYARARAERAGLSPRSRYKVGDMTRMQDCVPAASIDIAFCLINSIRHLPTAPAMHAHLAGVRKALKPGGIYVVGLSTSRAEWEFATEDVWEARRGGLAVRQVVQYEPPATARGRTERVVSHLTLTTASHVREVTSVYELRTWRLEPWRKMIASAGLELVGVVDEDGEAIEAPVCGYGVWVLGKGRRAATQ